MDVPILIWGIIFKRENMKEKIEIKNLSIIFGHDKSKAKRMLMEGKDKAEILKSSGCTVAVRNVNLEIMEGEVFVVMGLSGS